MSLQKTSLPALLIAAGAWMEAPPPEVVVAAVVAALFLLEPPHPATARARRTKTAPASAFNFGRDTVWLLSLIGLTKIRFSDLLVPSKCSGIVRKGDLPGLEHVAPI